MGYKITPPITVPGLGGWTYQGDVSLGDPPAGSFYADQTSMSSGSPTIELNVTDDNGIDHTDWLQDLVNTNHLVLRNRKFPADSLVFELSTNTPGAGFRTLVGVIQSGNGTFRAGSTYDLWSITTSENFVVGPASAANTSVPTFSDTTGKVVQNHTDFFFASGEVHLDSSTAAVEIQERNLAPTFAIAKGHIWVRDDVPNTLVFTDDTGVDHPIFDFVTGPASAANTSVPTFSDTTGKVVQNHTDFFFASGEVHLDSSTAAVEIQERNLAPTFAADKGHVWVKDDAPTTLTFTDDTGVDHPIVPPNTVVLGEWTFGSSSLGVTAIGEFETNNANLLLITAIRFNASPNSGQSMIDWASLLPQEGILYLQDKSDPGGTSVTFPYLGITFPLGAGWPQFNGNILATNGVDFGTNWSANDYSLQIVAVAPSLDSVILGSDPDNDVTVLSTEPIIFRDNAVNFTVFEIVSTNATTTTPSIKVTKQTSSSVAFQTEASGVAGGISITPTAIEPYANTTSNVDYYLKPADGSHGAYQGVNVWVLGGAHTGSLRGGNLTLEAGASTSGTNGIVAIGAVASEIIIGSSATPGVTITEGTDHPVAPAAAKAQLWVKSDYEVPTVPSDYVKDGQALMMTTDTGTDINMSWLAANYKSLIGGQLAFAHLEEGTGFAGGTAKSVVDTSVSYIFDHLSNMWYQAFIDGTDATAKVTSSSDGGYDWETYKSVETASPGDLGQPCTNGTNLGVAVDGNFRLSTDLTAANLPLGITGSASSMDGTTGLVWSVQESLWVMCGDSVGTSGYIYTSPDGITWTNRTPAGMTTDTPVSMDIAHTGFGGYNGTERILVCCGASSTSTWTSTNGGVSWTEDTATTPIGMQTVLWCPSIVGASTSANGAWLGVDASSNLYVSTNNLGNNFVDTTFTARTIFRTPEFAGWGNNSSNQTMFQIASVSDSTLDGIALQDMGITWQNGRAMCSSASANIRARYQWGNGVIMFDRTGDGELMIGRYGPIEPLL